MAVVVVRGGVVVAPPPGGAAGGGEHELALVLGGEHDRGHDCDEDATYRCRRNGPAAASTAPLCRRRHWSARSKDVSPPARAVAPVPLAAIVPRNVERSTWTENCRSTRIKSGRSRACRTGVSPRGGGLCGGGRLTRSRSGSGSGTDALRPSSSWR